MKMNKFIIENEKEVLQKFEKAMERSVNNKSVRIQLPKSMWEQLSRHKMVYRTLDLSTGRIGMAPASEIKEILKEHKEDIPLKTRKVNFGEVEVLYTSVGMAKKKWLG